MELYTEARDTQGKIHFRLLHQPKEGIVITRWFGQQNLRELKKGASKLQRFLQLHPGKYIGHLNDTSQISNYLEITNYPFNVLFVPGISSLGIQYQAEVRSDEQYLSDPSNQRPLINIGDTKLGLFKETADAQAWLAFQKELIPQ